MHILNYIQTFVAVVNEGSFTTAAKELRVSKSVVSKKISQLEQHLNTQLLHRTTRQLNTTEVGETFYHYAKNIIEKSREAEQAMLPLQENPQGILKITIPESLAISIIPEVLSGFLERYPEIELDVLVSGKFVDLLKTDVDVALRVGDLKDSSLISRRLMSCKFQICASKNYLNKCKKPIIPNDLKSHNCLIYSPSQKPDAWIFKKKGEKEINVKIKGNLRSNSGKLLLDSAINGQGILLAPSYMINNYIKKNKLVPVLEEYLTNSVGVYAIYPHSQFVPPKVRIFIDYLTKNLE
jgi:DNA-binding transcriptional LysR family regulator